MTRPGGGRLGQPGQRLALEAKPAVRVVLQHEHVVLVADLQQGPPLLGRQRGAGRVLEVGDRVEQPRHPAGRARRAQRLHVHAVVLHRQRQDVHAVQAQLQQRAVVGGRLDGHQVAGLEQRLEQEHEPLERSVRHQHLVGRRAVLGGQDLAQRRVAVAGAVGEHADAVLLEGERARTRRSGRSRVPPGTGPRGRRRSSTARRRSLVNAPAGGAAPGGAGYCARRWAARRLAAACAAFFFSTDALATQKLLMPSGLGVNLVPV